MGVALKQANTTCTQGTISASMNAVIASVSGSMATFHDGDVIKLGDDLYMPIIFYV